MNLVQKLPIGLGLACLMLSSCSKENVQTPEPQAGIANEHSSLKSNFEVVSSSPLFPTTIGGEVNHMAFPRNWERSALNPENLEAFPAGTSSFNALWGHWYQQEQWVKPLPPVPSNPLINSMLTVRSFASLATQALKRSYVHTTMKNLKPGKTYAVTVYVASSINHESLGLTKPVYAKSAEIKLYPYTTGEPVNVSVDLKDKQAIWVKKVITFTPTKKDVPFSFSGLTYSGDNYSYIHLVVDHNSLQELFHVDSVGN